MGTATVNVNGTAVALSWPDPVPAPTPPAPAPVPPAPVPSKPVIPFLPGLCSGYEPLDLSCAHTLGAKRVRIEFSIGATPVKLEPPVREYAAQSCECLLLAGFAGRMPSAAEAQSLGLVAKALGPNSGHPFPVRFIEFGNETSYYGNQYPDTAASYAERARVYAARAKEAGEALAGSGVGLLVQASDGGSPEHVWVDQMFGVVPDLLGRVSGWTVHPYRDWGMRVLRRMLADLARHGDTTLPIDVTEFGYCTDKGRLLSDGSTYTYQDAALLLASQTQELKQATNGRLRHAMVYQVRDQKKTGEVNNREAYFGALQHEGQSKLLYTEAVKTHLAS